MKLACTSGAFHHALVRGDLTQLEFLDHAARELACDGVVLDVRHFPRSDDDYLAQTKKMSVDLGLTIAALDDDRFFSLDADAMAATLRMASLAGAPILSGRLAAETQMPWAEQLQRLGVATQLAKRENVTLAIRNAPDTFAATTLDCKRVSKEADSAWLRFGLDASAFDAASDVQALRVRQVMAWMQDAFGDEAMARELHALESFRGFAVVYDPTEDAAIPSIKATVARLRAMLARKELNRI